MKHHVYLSLTVLALASSLSWSGVEKKIELNEVPDNIMATAKEMMTEAKYLSANTETEDDGTTLFEIQGKLPDGRKVEVDIFANGDVEEIEVEFTRDLVPGAVLNAIEKKLPGFQATYIEASHSKSKKVVQYELVGKVGETPMDLEVSADGRKIIISDQ